MPSDPLIVGEDTKLGDRGRRVVVECREPSPCMSVRMHGASAVVHAAVEALERIHQSAHALREEP